MKVTSSNALAERATCGCLCNSASVLQMPLELRTFVSGKLFKPGRESMA